jgi:hypothetical protein
VRRFPTGARSRRAAIFGFEKSDGAATWEPVNESVTSVGPMLEANIGTDGTVLSDGRVLFTFGASSELFESGDEYVLSPARRRRPAVPAAVCAAARPGRVLFTANLVHEPIPATLFVARGALTPHHPKFRHPKTRASSSAAAP